MTLKKTFGLLFFFLCQCICAQQDSIVRLDEVKVSDTKLKKFSDSQSVLKLPDSVIVANRASLTSLVNYNSVIYFKENGLGMVSSPSFRGTTAQQTAVIWNGININSQLNGQTDFNTITAKDFNSISIRAGGGSTIYGSSAIGGSIHLNNDLSFGKRFATAIQTSYGSFNTFGLHIKTEFATKKFSTQVSISRNSSDNDYPYLHTNLKNENGQFHNTSYNVNTGYKLNEKNILKLYSAVFDGERHFSGTLAAPSKSKYLDFNTRNLLEWTGIFSRFTSKARVAFLTEKYRYYENAATSIFSDGKANTVIAKYDLAYKVATNLELNAVIDYTKTKGSGSSLGNNSREIASGVLLLKHTLSKKFLYELTVRKEFTENYKSPALFSVGTNYAPAAFYHLKVNASRNFRIPTFNDLFYQGSGNTELKPESSFQAEIGHEFTFKNIRFSLTNYYIKIQDLLRWSPGSNGNWTPDNVAKVTTYGAEVLAGYAAQFGKNSFDFSGTYAYTVSEDDQKKKQLIYVPYHKITASLAYSRSRFSAHYQYLFNGKVFTSTDNFYSLKEYLVSNAGISYAFGKKKMLTLGADVLNLFDENYQSVATRPLPGRNYTFNINFNF